MMTRPAHRLAAGLAVIGLLALTGCSDDAEGGGSESSSAATSPLTAYFADVDQEFDQEESDRQQVEIENLVAECMADAGFEYIPQDNTGSTVVMDETDMEEQNTEEWISKNGYGMWSYNEEPTDEADEEVEEWVDPNADYVASLSESAAAAYYETLNGPDIWSDMTEEEMETYEYDWEQAGCYGWASNEVYPDMAGADSEFEPLFDAMNAMYEEQMSSPELKTLQSEWSACMADAGYPDLATPEDAMNSVNEQQNALWENLPQPENPDDPDAVWPEPSAEDLKAVKENDIETALADFRCKESVKWTEREQKVTFALEEQFIKDHKAELDAYKASMIEDAAAS